MTKTSPRFRYPLGLLAALALFLIVPLSACTGDDDGVEIHTQTPEGSAPTLEPGATEDPEATPTPDDPGDRVRGMSCEERVPLREQLEADVASAMEGYNGDWGFVLYDLGCEDMATVHGDYLQYTASSNKIISAIAAVRAVQAGDVAVEQIEPHLIEVFTWSSDADANALETFVTPADLDAVLVDSGTSPASYVDGAWNYTFLTAPDMARIWAALVRGELLNQEWTAYLLEKTTLVDVPEPYVTWPSGTFELEGFEYGQKAGYWVSDGIPYHLVGAGFLLDLQDADQSFIPVAIMKSNNEDLYDPQRRRIWPLVVKYVATVTDTPLPSDEAIGP